MLTVSHDWLQHLEIGNEMCSIFFDLKKAFDIVHHHGVQLHRLEEIAVDPYTVQLICSYLTCRSQVMVVGGEQSSAPPVILGVLCSWASKIFIFIN